MVAYLDAAAERVADHVRRSFEDAVEAARLGMGFLYDHAAYHRWHSRIRRAVAQSAPGGGGLTGAALDQAITAIALRRPDLVVATG